MERSCLPSHRTGKTGPQSSLQLLHSCASSDATPNSYTGSPHNARVLVAHDTLHEVEMEAQRGLHCNPEASQLRDRARPSLYTHVVCEHHYLHRSHLRQL